MQRALLAVKVRGGSPPNHTCSPHVHQSYIPLQLPVPSALATMEMPPPAIGIVATVWCRQAWLCKFCKIEYSHVKASSQLTQPPCAGPLDGSDADGPLVHLRDLPPSDQAEGEWVVLVPMAESNAFLEQLAADQRLQSRVKGVLVDDSGE